MIFLVVFEIVEMPLLKSGHTKTMA